MMRISLYFCLLSFLFSCSPEETLRASKIQFETLEMSFHLSSTSVCSRVSTNGSKNGASSSSSSRLEVVHRYGPCAAGGGEKALTLAEILAKDQLRVNSIQESHDLSYKNKVDSGDYQIQIPAHPGLSLDTFNYVVTIGLGTPKHELTLVFDTGSDLTWIQCLPCFAHDCYPQKEPMFSPSHSSTYSRIHCTSQYCAELGDHKRGGPGCLHKNPDCPYIVEYEGGQKSTGFYSKDKLTLSLGDRFYSFRFGCGNYNKGSFGKFAGILGLGRGRTSIVSQRKNRFKQVFSYCLPDISSTGFLSFGGEYNDIKDVVFTPLVPGPLEHYYIDITAISVGGNRLPIHESVFTNAGTIIDSGTVNTYLPPDAYKAMRTEFKSQMNILGHVSAPAESSLDTCFHVHKKAKIPTISFTFKGDVRIRLAGSGILYFVDSGLACLDFIGNKHNRDLAVFGNSQQATLEVVYDVPRKRLGFRSNPHCY